MNIQLVSNFSNFDYTITIIIFLSCLFAFAKGFIRTSISFLGWVSIFGLSLTVYPFALKFLASQINAPVILHGAAGVSGFMLSVITVSAINYKLLGMCKGISGGLVDRSLGLIFGLLRGCILSCIIFWSISLISTYTADTESINKSDPHYATKILPEWLKNSKSFYLVKNTSSYLGSFLPNNLEQNLQTIINPSSTPPTSPPTPAPRSRSFVLSPATTASQSSSFGLSPSHLKTLNSLVKALPSNITSTIDPKAIKKLETDQLITPENKALLTELLNLYDQAMQSDEISKQQLLSPDQLEEIKGLLDLNQVFSDSLSGATVTKDSKE